MKKQYNSLGNKNTDVSDWTSQNLIEQIEP